MMRTEKDLSRLCTTTILNNMAMAITSIHPSTTLENISLLMMKNMGKIRNDNLNTPKETMGIINHNLSIVITLFLEFLPLILTLSMKEKIVAHTLLSSMGSYQAN